MLTFLDGENCSEDKSKIELLQIELGLPPIMVDTVVAMNSNFQNV